MYVQMPMPYKFNQCLFSMCKIELRLCYIVMRFSEQALKIKLGDNFSFDKICDNVYDIIDNINQYINASCMYVLIEWLICHLQYNEHIKNLQHIENKVM